MVPGAFVGCVLLAVILVVLYFALRRKRVASPSSRKRENSAVLAGLRQNLRLKVGWDEATIDRLIGLERERLPKASLQTLMEAAIERWERDNR
jgi:hypothetical protein